MTTPDPFAALGLPARPDLSDEQVRAAWRTVAAATHPDRPGGGNPAASAASAAYAALRTPWGRSEAYADLMASGLPSAARRARPGRARPGTRTARALLLIPARIRHGRPWRLAGAHPRRRRPGPGRGGVGGGRPGCGRGGRRAGGMARPDRAGGSRRAPGTVNPDG
jgi:curved DNA-binding protein CbpA